MDYEYRFAPTKIERATVYVNRASTTELESISNWITRWSGAMVMRSQESVAGNMELYDIVAPAKALDELSASRVLRYS